MNVLRRASHLAAVSPSCKPSIQRSMSARSPIDVVPNGVDGWILDSGEWRLVKEEPLGPLTVATVLEGFQQLKKPKMALAAFAQTQQVIPNARLVMFGTNFGVGENAELWARAKNLQHGVIHGESSARRARTLLSPNCSFADPSIKGGIVWNGSAGDHGAWYTCDRRKQSGGVVYVLDGGAAGLLVDVASASRFSEATRTLWQNPKWRHQLAQRG